MSKQVTLNLSDEQIATVNQLRKTRDKSFDELVLQAFDRGLSDICYRTKRNREQYQQFKEWKKNQTV